MTLEELLNKLIKKGWRPFWNKYASACVLDGDNLILRFSIRLSWPDNKHCLETMRTITAKESWLWQFVCENEMVDINYWNTREYYSEPENWGRLKGEYNYEYRLIESALKDESELEQFLLDNIKIDE